MTMTAPPARTAISDTYPNPSNAVARTGFGVLWDYVTGLLGSTGFTAGMLAASGILDPKAQYNIGMAFSVGSNALTAVVKSADGSTSLVAGNPATIAQRSATAATGIAVSRNITADITLVVSSGSTLGHTSAVAGLLYWYLIDNAGAQELAVSSKDFGPMGIVTTTAEGGAGAADTATVMYSATARTNVPFRRIARTTDTQTTAGTWTAVPSLVEIGIIDERSEGTFTPGISFGSGGVTGITYTTQEGTYTKIGRRVTCDVYILLSSKGSSVGLCRITGLPFLSATGNNVGGGAAHEWVFSSAVVSPTVSVDSNATVASLRRSAAAAPGSSGSIADTEVTNTSMIKATFSYLAAF